MESRSELIALLKSEIEKCGLGELSKTVGVSKTYLSLFAADKISWDSTKLEAKLHRYFDIKLSFRDERRLLAIIEILSECDNPHAVIDQITTDSE